MTANKRVERQTLYETVIYAIMWAILFIAPILSLFVRYANNSSAEPDWTELQVFWRELAVFFVAFLLHNHLLAPLLIYRRKRILYFTSVAVMLGAFMLYQCSNRPFEHEPRHEQADCRPEAPGRPSDKERPMPPFEHDGMKPRPPREMPMDMHDKRPPLMAGQHDIIASIILVLMLGMNIGIKLFFKQRNDNQRMEQLEKQSLEQQLEYLKFQINPHFFMNTLNNIHALVDIDPERAKETIIELSKMMRFILYEGDKQGVPLIREMDFIRNYVKLMQLRYTEKVSIKLELPSQLPEGKLPPLMLITFIENAFKHGVSYQKPSFIDIIVRLTGNERLHFECHNSKGDPQKSTQSGGVGLANVKKRLELLFGDGYSLDIQDQKDTFNVTLEIPLTHDQMHGY